MRAAVLEKPHQPLVLKDVPKPSNQPGHVLLRVRACGVCRTDLHIVEGELKSLRSPLIPGHQIVGEVVEGDLPLGTRVGVSWLGGVDGSCPYCKRGQENLCDAPTFTGYSVEEATPSTPSPARISSILFRTPSATSMPRRSSAQGSSVSAVSA